MKNVIFHLAIPARDMDEAVLFYSKLGKLGRRTGTWAIFNIQGMQLVCHQSDEIPDRAKMYPRHFGFIITDRQEFDGLFALAVEERYPFLESEFVRFPGTREEHQTFFLKDPSNNVIEFKWYKNPESIFGT